MLALLGGVVAYDSQAFKASDEDMERVWNRPNCEDVTEEWIRDPTKNLRNISIPWADVRKRITKVEKDETTGEPLPLFPGNMPAVMSILFEVAGEDGMRDLNL